MRLKPRSAVSSAGSSMIIASIVGTRNVWVACPCKAMAMKPAASKCGMIHWCTPRTSEGRKKAPDACAMGAAWRKAVSRRKVGHQVHEEGRKLRGLAQRRQRDRFGRTGGPAGEAEAIGCFELAVHAAGTGRPVVDEAAERVPAVDHRRAEALGAVDVVVNQAARTALAQLVAMVRRRLAHVERDPHEAPTWRARNRQSDNRSSWASARRRGRPARNPPRATHCRAGPSPRRIRGSSACARPRSTPAPRRTWRPRAGCTSPICMSSGRLDVWEGTRP